MKYLILFGFLFGFFTQANQKPSLSLNDQLFNATSSIEQTEKLLQQGANPNVDPSDHVNVKSLFAGLQRVPGDEYIKLLLKYNFDPNKTYPYPREENSSSWFSSSHETHGNTMLHHIVYGLSQNGFLDPSLYNMDKVEEVVKLLVVTGNHDGQKANINAKNREGNTPLHLARDISNIKQVRMTHILLKLGADPRLKNNDNKTASEYGSCLLGGIPCMNARKKAGKLIKDRLNSLIQ